MKHLQKTKALLIVVINVIRLIIELSELLLSCN